MTTPETSEVQKEDPSIIGGVPSDKDLKRIGEEMDAELKAMGIKPRGGAPKRGRAQRPLPARPARPAAAAAVRRPEAVPPSTLPVEGSASTPPSAEPKGGRPAGIIKGEIVVPPKTGPESEEPPKVIVSEEITARVVAEAAKPQGAEAPEGPAYEPKFITAEAIRKIQDEENMRKLPEDLRLEDARMDQEGVGSRDRVDFWQSILDSLNPDDPFYELKKMAFEARIERAKKEEESLRQGAEEVAEQMAELEETNRETRAADIVFAEGVPEDEARERAEGEASRKDERNKEEAQVLQALDGARERLVKAEKKLKEYEGLKGFFKGFLKKDEKASVETEYEDAQKEYQEARAEYVAGHVELMLDERMALADRRARELHKERGWCYKNWKKLGELNGEALYKKVFGKEIESKIRRFAARVLSVRLGVSAILLGGGLLAGAGTATGLGFFLARRGLAGAGAGFGTYDILKLGTEKWATSKGWRAEITEEELKRMSLAEIEERMTHFEINAPLNGKKVSENEIYGKLVERYKALMEQEASEKGSEVDKFLKESMEAEDRRLTELEAKAKRNEKIMTGVAVGMGLVAGSGLISKLISGKWGWEQFTGARAVKTEMRQAIGQAPKVPPEVPAEAPPVGPVEAHPLDLPVDKVAEQVNLPKEFIAPLAEPAEGYLTPDQAAELGQLQKNLTELGLDPQDAQVIKGLGISKVEDIVEAERNLEALRGIKTDPQVLREVIARGLDQGDAPNLKSLLESVGKAPLSQGAKDAVVSGAIDNNFEGSGDMMKILEKVDAEHLRTAGIVKSDGIFDAARLKEIATVKTITIDEKGEGIYKVLKDFYSLPKERGGLGLSGQELRVKLLEQLKNPVFYKNGQLQDLVKLGDQIRVDSQGNVLLFVSAEGKMGRLKDVLGAVGGRSFRSGNQVFELPEGARVTSMPHPIDGHTIIKITDAKGVEHTVSDWSAGKTVRIGGRREVLEDWLKENNLIAKSRPVKPTMAFDEMQTVSEVRRDIVAGEPARLRSAFLDRQKALEIGDADSAARAEVEIQDIQKSLGISHEEAKEMARSAISPDEVRVLKNARSLNKFLKDSYVKRFFGYEWNVLHIKHYQPSLLANLDSKLKKLLENWPKGRELPASNLRMRDSLGDLQRSIGERLAILRRR